MMVLIDSLGSSIQVALSALSVVIDVHEGKLSLRVGSETVTFNIGKSIKSKHSRDNYLYCADHTAKLVQEQWVNTVNHDEKWAEEEEEEDSNKVHASFREIPNRQKRECDMRFILTPKSAKAFLTARGPIRHGSVKLSGSPSFWGRLLWIIAEHSSLSLTEEAAFQVFPYVKGDLSKPWPPLACGSWLLGTVD
ncbi:hypothetical protein Tco_1313555 [Tanacetum coccineum]